MVESGPEHDEAPARGYLISAGVPAGLLLWLGSKWVLDKVGDSEEYRKNAAGTLMALRWLQGIGIALALLSALSFLWIFRRFNWRDQK